MTLNLRNFLYITDIICPWSFYPNSVPWALATIVISSLMLVKDILSIISLPRGIYFFTKIENLGHLVILGLVIITTYPEWTVSQDNQITLHVWQYQAAAVGVFLAWTLILGQIGKTPRLGIYVEILSRVLKSFGLFVLTFISVLIAFALSFAILMPQVSGQKSFKFLSSCI